MRPFSLVKGYLEGADRVYLVFSQNRYWVTDPRFFCDWGLSWSDVQQLRPGRHISKEGRAISTARDLLALMHLNGEGIEIGALHNPSLLPDYVRVTYVDYISPEESKKRYPDLDVHGSRNVVIDDGEILQKIPAASLDFIVANHFLEHARNPLGVIRNHLTRLKPGGIISYALPDKRFTFDIDRPVTSFPHLVIDDQHGYQVSDWGHYLEYVRYVDRLTEIGDIERHARVLLEMDNRIHYHVWDAAGARDFFKSAEGYLAGTFKLVKFVEERPEVVVLLEKVA